MDEKCRLCEGPSTPTFRKQQLDYDVAYFHCDRCGSIQTESPYWINEAYTDLSFAIDTGMAGRTIFTSKLALALACLEQFAPNDVCIDFGGGTGLFTRLLRDGGLNAFWNDKYCKNIFSLGFEKALEPPVKLVTAFEVLEHLPAPLETLAEIFAAKPAYFLCSTKLYTGQGEQWWYFLDNGQHVQFYTKKGLDLLAGRFGYHVQSAQGTYHLFSKEPCHPKLLKRLLKKAQAPTLQVFESRTELDHQALMESALSTCAE